MGSIAHWRGTGLEQKPVPQPAFPFSVWIYDPTTGETKANRCLEDLIVMLNHPKDCDNIFLDPGPTA
ncbi:unnamed protein product [Nezara viridula]|uniref:Uncharacterized protein n=1 Tax=Nezara viridula TaxID=85310 RepID=A0A9P0E1S1_NEZVI|nr:unnamed protein product [Nezara viridula]